MSCYGDVNDDGDDDDGGGDGVDGDGVDGDGDDDDGGDDGGDGGGSGGDGGGSDGDGDSVGDGLVSIGLASFAAFRTPLSTWTRTTVSKRLAPPATSKFAVPSLYGPRSVSKENQWLFLFFKTN